MNPNLLIVTVGLPRSGKSTWARQQGCPIVCPDSIRLALHGARYAQLAEPFVWAIAQTMVLALFLAGCPRVILDATNNTRKRRSMWVSDLWSTEFHVLSTSKETCIRRAIADDDQEILVTIERMAHKHEPVSDDERKLT